MIPTLKPGEKIRFELNGIHHDKITGKLVCPNSYALKPYDRIFDPWGGAANKDNKEYGFDGAYVDIAYIEREIPAPQDSNRDTVVEFGRVKFLKTLAGSIEIIGGRREMEGMLPYLFFSNKNTTNADKPWFIRPQGVLAFHQVEKRKKAAEKLKTELRIDKAKAIITNMDNNEIDAAAAGLAPDRHRSMSPEDKVLELRRIAARNPEKIIDLSKDVEVRTTAFIEECLKAQIIDLDNNKNQFVWSDDKTKICAIKAGSTPHNSLKRFFMTDNGAEVLDQMEKQLELSKKPKKEKTEKVVV